MTRVIVVAALVVGAPACAPEQGVEAIPAYDEQSYRQSIHPIVEARCGTLDCHGDPGRSLRLYSETGLRMRDDLRGALLDDAEVSANLRSIAAIDPAFILSKPLAGGFGHEGLDVWLDPDEAQPACVAAWLEGRSGEPAAMAACAQAVDEVALPPP